MIFAQLGKAQINLAMLSFFAKIRPLRGNYQINQIVELSNKF